MGEAAAIPDPKQRATYLRRRMLFLADRHFPRTARLAARSMARFGYHRNDKVVEFRPRATDPNARATKRAYLNYRGTSIDFPVHLYETEWSAMLAHRPVLNWSGQLHGGFTISRIAGDHYTMFDDEHVGSLATMLARDLAKVRAEQR